MYFDYGCSISKSVEEMEHYLMSNPHYLLRSLW